MISIYFVSHRIISHLVRTIFPSSFSTISHHSLLPFHIRFILGADNNDSDKESGRFPMLGIQVIPTHPLPILTRHFTLSINIPTISPIHTSYPYQSTHDNMFTHSPSHTPIHLTYAPLSISPPFISSHLICTPLSIFSHLLSFHLTYTPFSSINSALSPQPPVHPPVVEGTTALRFEEPRPASKSVDSTNSHRLRTSLTVRTILLNRRKLRIDGVE